MKQMKEEADKFRVWKLKKEKEINQLKQQVCTIHAMCQKRVPPPYQYSLEELRHASTTDSRLDSQRTEY